MFAFVTKAMNEVEAQLEVVVVAVVADNENANRSLFGLLQNWRDCLRCIGCNAHGWQLVLSNIFDMMPLVKQVDRVLRIFDRNPNMKEILLRAQQTNPRSLVYWGETRWNSKVDAMSRVLQLSSAINFVLMTLRKSPQTKGRRDPFSGESQAFSEAFLPSDRSIA